LALDSQNNRGYDFLLFRATALEGKKPQAVTLYDSHWHKLLHDGTTKQPYLGEPRADIHEYDRDSNPLSKSENKADGSDSELEAESFMKKGKQ